MKSKRVQEIYLISTTMIFCSFVFNIVHKIAKRCVNKDVSRQFGIYYYFLEFLEESFGVHCTNVLTLTIVIVHVLDSCELSSSSLARPDEA